MFVGRATEDGRGSDDGGEEGLCSLRMSPEGLGATEDDGRGSDDDDGGEEDGLCSLRMSPVARATEDGSSDGGPECLRADGVRATAGGADDVPANGAVKGRLPLGKAGAWRGRTLRGPRAFNQMAVLVRLQPEI